MFLISEVLVFLYRKQSPFCFPLMRENICTFQEMTKYLPFDRVPQMSDGEWVQIWIDFCTAICFDKLPFVMCLIFQN